MTTLRGLVTKGLVAFVVFTSGYAVGKEVGQRRAAEQPAPGATARASETAPHHQLVVRYYHATKRCAACNRIEAWAREALEARFPRALAAGTVEWDVENMDDAWNRDAALRYDLVRSSLVLVELEDGKEKDASVLGRTWDLADDRPGFFDYLESEVEMVIGPWHDADDRE